MDYDDWDGWSSGATIKTIRGSAVHRLEERQRGAGVTATHCGLFKLATPVPTAFQEDLCQRCYPRSFRARFPDDPRYLIDLTRLP